MHWHCRRVTAHWPRLKHFKDNNSSRRRGRRGEGEEAKEEGKKGDLKSRGNQKQKPTELGGMNDVKRMAALHNLT